jgi:hypothetical protein
MKTLEEMIRELPPELRQEAEDFVKFLVDQRLKRPRSKPKFNWAGALKDWRDEFTAVELQHKIAEWRADEDAASH